MANEVLIYDAFGQGGITAKSIAEQLQAFNGDDITVRINSPGGSVFEGLAVYNLLKDYPGKKTVKIDGVALSMASGVAMAGDEIEAAENALLMMHLPIGAVRGNVADVQRTLNMLESSKQSLIVAYANRSGIDPADIENMMAAETWLTAKEAQAKGFVHTIGNHNAIAASFDIPEEYNIPANMVGKVAPFFLSSKPTEEVQAVAESKTDTKDQGPQPATLAELKNLKGSDNDFVVNQSLAGATLTQAQNALNEILLDRLAEKDAELEASQTAANEARELAEKRAGDAPGHDPISNDGDDEGELTPDSLLNQFNELIHNEAKRVGNPITAYRNVNRKHPGLIDKIRDQATEAHAQERK